MANAGNIRGGYGRAAFGGLGAVGVGFGGGRGYLAGGGGGYYGGGYRAYEDNRPRPYNFGYVAQAVGGSSSRQEVGDGNGAVQGVYTITTAEGGQRKVKYTADAAGFRAVVDTNEPGTQSESPADVALRSSSPPAYLLAAKYGPTGSSYAGVRPRAVYGGGGAAAYGASGLYGGLGGRGVGAYAGGAGVGLHGKHGGWH
ncbi:adult-specific rigid cuticular protein 15.7-like [Rhipicephalus sanguineus]|uniref:Cuticular protein n=1 Tax=Rhipicephalus sanguineus TaxID=34632 RepID=A0A9D4T893_RHISA|nr:adult-specific rigid cuticular protein 15.7-like [Rhipicephalus sanguineus]KAH7981860.1 hypothetical protein HPB52_001279 [Rhipicephalus sanguineus]